MEKEIKISEIDYQPPKIIEKNTLVVELYSDEPPVAPPWPG